MDCQPPLERRWHNNPAIGEVRLSSARSTAQGHYDHLLPFIEESANQYYGGNLDRGFRHWAFSLIFGVGHDIQDTDIIDLTAIDGADDFEIDGWFIPDTEDDSVVNLFQSKHRQPGTTMGANALAAFLNAPSRIASTEEAAASRNEETRALHEQLLGILRHTDSNHIVNLVWATSGKLSPAARRNAESNRSRTITVEVGGNPVALFVTLTCWDLEDLYRLHLSQQESDDTTACDVEFQLQPGSYHQISSEYPTVSMTVPVKQIIEAFGRHRYRIFRLNPRGPLGNKVNASIKATLNDPVNRRRFHLLNNGITASCLSWRLEGEHRLHVDDFQIINGCQTTVTLWDARLAVQEDSNVLVTVKLAQCPEQFAPTIAATSNRQTALRAEDFTSNEPVQLRLRDEFATMVPSWFYEIKRGQWTKMLGGPQERSRYQSSQGGFRKLTSKEIAQAVTAFAGFPGEAKDKIRSFLNKETLSSTARDGDFSYDGIYTNTLSAKQLLLPAVIQRMVWGQVAENTAHEEWLEYARFHIVWLIADLLRDHYELRSQHLLPTFRSEVLVAQIEDWFRSLYNVAVVAIRNARNEAERTGRYAGHREFFRTASNYRLIESMMHGSLQMAKDYQDPMATLPV